eukprot:8232122-Alexandrium_andersonii.AAC.1
MEPGRPRCRRHFRFRWRLRRSLPRHPLPPASLARPLARCSSASRRAGRHLAGGAASSAAAAAAAPGILWLWRGAGGTSTGARADGAGPAVEAEPMVWAWVPVAQVRDMRARALSYGGLGVQCDLCGVDVAVGVTGSACSACLAAFRLVRALGSSGRRLSHSRRD